MRQNKPIIQKREFAYRPYINIARCLAMYLVIFGHITHNVSAENIIYSFHMPLFFVLSGLVFKPYKPGSKFIKKKIKTLIIPYIIFYILTLAVFWIVEQPLRDPAVKNAAAHNELLRFIPLLYGADVKHLMSHNIELWFLPCLFSIEIIYNAICIHIKNNYGTCPMA